MNTEKKSNTPLEIKDLWQTPRIIFDSLDREFNFDCDVAASSANHLCQEYYSEENSALDPGVLWGKSNWCNPPYSNISPWVEMAEVQHGLGRSTVMLVPSDTSVKWFKRAFLSCNEVRFISGRLSFANAATKRPVKGNNKGSVLLIWRGYCPASVRAVSLVDRDSLTGQSSK